MVFASPEWLFLLLALPLVVGLFAFCVRRDRERTARIVARALWPRGVRRDSEAARLFRIVLLGTGLVGLAMALARPQWGKTREKIEREGADVVLVLDSSGSMATADVAGSRFFLARAALLNLVARLEGDRFALVAFEGEAYPLVPLTLDADAVGLFLDTMEPGLVPAPGSSLGEGLARGLELLVDKERRNKVMVLVSDGENLEGEIEPAVQRAREASVVVHTVGVGTERGQPVPELNAEGEPTGFKKDEGGQVVVSRLDEATLETIARGTGGRYFRLTPSDPSLQSLAAAIEGLEQRDAAREFAYRRKERYQWPLGLAFFSLALALGWPLPLKTRDRLASAAPAVRAAAALLVVAGAGTPVWAQADPQGTPPAPNAAPSPAAATAGPTASRPRLLDEVLLRPRRLTQSGRKAFEQGDHPASLQSFEGASALRPDDPAARFNLADGLYKNGRFDEAGQLYEDLSRDPRSPLAAPSRYNLGNVRFQKQDYPGAIEAYKDALRLRPDDDTRRNLELALRALKEQEQQKQQKNKDDPKKQDQKDQGGAKESKNDPKQEPQKGGDSQPPRQKTAEERERERFEKETGMPKERALQLLEALERNEKAEHRKAMLAKRRQKKEKDW